MTYDEELEYAIGVLTRKARTLPSPEENVDSEEQSACDTAIRILAFVRRDFRNSTKGEP